jgi:amino acid adenylation domain-containing protein
MSQETNSAALRQKLAALNDEQKAALMQRLRQRQASTEPLSQDSLPGAEAPLSWAQARLWWQQQVEGVHYQYNMVSAYEFTGSLNVEALQTALNCVVQRHQTLASYFAQVDRPVHAETDTKTAYDQVALVQRQLSGFTLPLPLIDLSAPSKSEAHSELQNQLLAEARHGFDLSQGPLIRCHLYRLASDCHVFQLNVHHAVFDGWSKAIFFKELQQAYAALLQSQSPDLPVLSCQFADVARRQEMLIQQNELNFWRDYLKDAPPVQSLPLDFPRPAQASTDALLLPLQLDRALSQGLQQVAQAHGCTLFMVLLALFKLTLYRFAGRGTEAGNEHDLYDQVIGTPIDTRQGADERGLIGFFLNTLCIRTRIDPDWSWSELLAAVKQSVLAAFQHQRVPFEQVVEALKPERSQSYAPLFQSMFVLQHATAGAPTLEGLNSRKLSLGNGSTKYDVYFTLLASDQGLTGWLNVRRDLFRQGTVEALAHAYTELAQQLVTHQQVPDSRSLCQLDVLNAAARQCFYEHSRGADWQEPRSTVVDDAPSIAHAFQRLSVEHPQAVAVQAADESYSYQHLWQGAQRIAQRLRAHRVTSDESVALLLPRGPGQVMTQLAVWQLAAVVVPLDPNGPATQIQQGIEQSHARVLCYWQKLPAWAQDTAGLVWLDLHELLNCESVPVTMDDVPVHMSPQQAAYRLLTSGSTGVPKLVQLSHQGVMNRIRWQWQDYPWRADDVMAQRAGVAFVDAASELWSALLAVVPVVVVDDDTALDPFDFVDFMHEQQVTCLLLVPSLLRVLLDAYPEWAEYQPRLRRVFLSGEMLSHELLRRARESLPDVEWVNIYGASEAADVSAVNLNDWCEQTTAETEHQATGLRVPVGSAISGMRLYVLDDELNPCPVGVTGQLYAAGDSLAQGYWQQPRSTAERFLPDPFVTANSCEQSATVTARMYALGDRGRRLANGWVEYLGRGDQQMKLNGIRVEPAAIESLLEAMPGVVSAVLVNVPDVDGVSRLVAYVQASEEANIDERTLQQYRRAQLPDYLPLAALKLCDELPLNRSGKVDRQAVLAWGMPSMSHTRYHAETSQEQQLLPLWQEVLGLEQIAVEANFFELGGHSLSGVRLITLIKERLGIAISVPMLFQLSSLAAVAEHCRHIEQLSAHTEDSEVLGADESWEVSEF